jgi:hypothetical protein
LIRVVALPLRRRPGFTGFHYRCAECEKEERVLQDNRFTK